MHTDGAGLIGSLNLKPEYDGTTLLNNHLNVENENSLNIKLGSMFTDIPAFISKFAKTKKPIYLSLNIQSLMSKFESLKSTIMEFTAADLPIHVIALQETWSIKYPDLVNIPGFQSIVFSDRAHMRGGGWDSMFVRDSSSKRLLLYLNLQKKLLNVYLSNCSTQTKKLYYPTFTDHPIRPLIALSPIISTALLFYSMTN